jgi:hypothetical protein
MLTSELKGEVYNPAYYFSNADENVADHLDLVMLTHGWRRFNWDQVLSGKIPKPRFEKDTSYITLSGKLQGVLPSQIGKDADIVLMVKEADAEGKMFVVPLQPNGTFNDPDVFVFDTAPNLLHLSKKRFEGCQRAVYDGSPSCSNLNPATFSQTLWLVS